MDARDVAGYLKSHPEFFENHADLLAQVLIPDQHGGHAISITERQLGTLRERTKKLESKLAELLHFGEENDAIGEKLHRLGVALVAAEDFAALLAALYYHLGNDFAVPHCSLRLWGLDAPPGDEGRPEFAAPEAQTLSFAAGLKHPHCGPSAKLEEFLDLAPTVRSAAVVPLQCRTGTIGLLALGSEELHRFYPEMGTLFLSRLGDLVSSALWRTLRE